MNTNNKVGIYHLQIQQGADFREALQFFTDTIPRVPVDKTGYTYSAKINQYIDGLVVNTINLPVMIINLSLGQIYLNLVNTVTSNMNYTLAKWDLFETNTNTGLIKKIIAGDVYISPRVPR